MRLLPWYFWSVVIEAKDVIAPVRRNRQVYRHTLNQPNPRTTHGYVFRHPVRRERKDYR